MMQNPPPSEDIRLLLYQNKLKDVKFICAKITHFRKKNFCILFNYRGRQLYQYNEDDFNFDLNYTVKQHGYTKTQK